MGKIWTNKMLARTIALVCVVAMMMPFTIAMASEQAITLSSAAVGSVELAQSAQDAPVISAGSTIDISGNHSVAGCEVTFLVTPMGSGTPISGVGQTMCNENNGVFTFLIALPVVMDEGTYEVKVGGENIDYPVVRYFKIIQGLAKEITLTSNADSIKTIGGTLDLSAQVVNAVTGDSLVWSVVSGIDVASVNQSGKVTALKDGISVVRVSLSTNPAVYAQKTIVVDTTVIDNATFEVSITGDGSVESTGAYEGVIGGGSTVPSCAVGSEFELTAKASGDDKFICWVDMRSGRIVSTDTKYSFILGTTITLQPIFKSEADPALVMFIEKNDKIRLSKYVTNEIKVPNDPFYMGYIFDNWKNKKDLSALEFTAGETIPANTFNEDTVFVANHTKSSDKYTVTFTGVEGLTTGQYQYDSKITVTPVAPESGKKFAYWKKDGMIVSYESTYTFFVGSYDTVVEAIFEDDDTVVAPTPVLVISEPVVVSGNSIAFFSEKNLPTQYTLLENGIILSTDTATELTLSNAMYKGASTSVSNVGQTIVRKTNVSAGETWAGRAYMIYKDGDNIITVYSNTVTKTLE